MPSTTSTHSFHLLAKPTGAVCNLNCSYCFYLAKERLYSNSRLRMTDAVLESYLRQYLSAHGTSHITIAWQGGEPTLMGLAFFRDAIAYEQKYTRPHTVIEHTIQTNGTLLNEEWCAFFRNRIDIEESPVNELAFHILPCSEWPNGATVLSIVGNTIKIKDKGQPLLWFFKPRNYGQDNLFSE